MMTAMLAKLVEANEINVTTSTQADFDEAMGLLSQIQAKIQQALEAGSG